MPTLSETNSNASSGASQLLLRIWHPDCWTLEATEQTETGLVAHGVYQTDETTSARCTAYADSRDDIRELREVIEESSLTDSVRRVHEYFNPARQGNSTAGNTTEEFLVTYRSCNSIHDAFVRRGFVPEEAIRIHGGEEYWTVLITQDRAEIRRRLEAIRTEMDAEIAVEGMKSPETRTSCRTPGDQLSERQREVFKLAQREGYYQWPRETSAIELAEELGLAKTTLLEHLRKAEAKLLGSL